MDAPTTTSAGNGTSGDSGGGGWFTPRKPPAQGGAAPTPAPAEGASAGDAGQDRRAAPRRTVSSIRPVGSGMSRTAPQPADEAPVAEPVARAGVPATPVPGTHVRAAPAPDARFDDGSLDEVRTDGLPIDHVPIDHGATEYEAVEQAPDERPPRHEASSPHEPAQRPEDAAPPAAADDASPDAILIRRTMAEIAPVADKVTSYFYALLFVRHPELRGLFPAAMDSQRDRLLKALLTAAEHMDNAAVLTDYLQHLGRGHRKYGTQAAHYPAVGEALIGALTRYATSTWDEETEAAWIRTYTTISQIMIDAASSNERLAPAWWHGEVVSHDLRTPDIAIITVRPDQPYAFLAGQYTSLETPWWPRIWRHYSFAGAPRPDGLLSFHVKAVPAGWVSNALVHHARPGDILRLGPPAGSMTVDHSTDNGLLCLGGGTGIAPIKALVEDVAEHGEQRRVQVFYGARTDFDLYDIDTMLRLQQTHPWLSVRPVVDGRSQFPDAVREYGPWYEYDAYLSGPAGMIRSGVDALRGIGIPQDRIRHDSLEELVAAGD
ncbi:flavohemoprotein [Streptomyces lunaelactis]|nr:globin domain-containing protein [Streptomyces lunaelactis]NUL09495.1 flavohemoprotein [Streptomyces lunaelactis]NUL23291.1 flavohemoprotein [Streptomyces lunaelactis]